MAGNQNSGRKPLPANVHVLQGNASKRSAASLTDTLRPPTATPAAPAHLSDDARAEWDRVTPLLAAMGLIAEMYMTPLAVYCQAWGRYVAAERKLAELGERGLVENTPSGYKQMGVWLQISNRAAEQMKTFASEFGMTPSAIARVSGSVPQGDLFGYGEQETKGASRFFAK
ncbi:MAG: phage terminase small subunit P27 family [Rhodocyclaceae bacterium]